MKKVFMPSMDDLYKMQDMGCNIKLYLYAKAIEALCIEYNNYYNKDSILRHEFKYIQEDEIISHAVCSMYPKEIEYSAIAKYDTSLASLLITKDLNNDIYRLDNLSRFTTLAAEPQTAKVIDILCNELVNNPKYRFEYRQTLLNTVLDDIFMGKIEVKEVYPYDSTSLREEYIRKLAKIEPFYAMQSMDDSKRAYYLKYAIIDYINRYGFNYNLPSISSGYYSEEKKDILTNQSTEVKRLFRCINRK